MTLPAVRVIVLGGTITMAPSTSTGITPTLTGEDLLKMLPSLKEEIQLEVSTPFLKPGASLELIDILEVAEQINKEEHSVGTVVVQGTDTIDEVSYLLSLLVNPNRTVVVTGAMRGANALSADGPSNLMASIRTAADKATSGLGVVVCMNDEIHAARSVKKCHKALLSSFESLQGGPVGYVFEDRVHIIRRCRPYSLHLKPKRFAKVALVKIGLDSEADIIEVLPSLGYEAVIIEASGVGHLQAKLVPALAELAARMPVVLASRVNRGPIFENTYGFSGSEIDLLSKGLLSAHWLTANKARLLLASLIGAEVAAEDLPNYLAEFAQA